MKIKSVEKGYKHVTFVCLSEINNSNVNNVIVYRYWIMCTKCTICMNFNNNYEGLQTLCSRAAVA